MTDNLKERADAATTEVQDILGVSADTHPSEIADAIERTIINVILEERQRCSDVASKCLKDDQKNEQTIVEEINRTNAALVANLSAMR